MGSVLLLSSFLHVFLILCCPLQHGNVSLEVALDRHCVCVGSYPSPHLQIHAVVNKRYQALVASGTQMRWGIRTARRRVRESCRLLALFIACSQTEARKRCQRKLTNADVRLLDLPKAKSATRGAPPRVLPSRKTPCSPFPKKENKTPSPRRGVGMCPED